MVRWILMSFVMGVLVLGTSGCLTALSSLTGGSGSKNSEPEQPTEFALVETEGFTGPVHEQYKGKVVFAAAKIERAPEDDSKFKDTFSLSGPLFMRVYMEDSLYNIMAKQDLKPMTRGMFNSTAPGFSFKFQINDAPEEDWVAINYFTIEENYLEQFTAFGIDNDSEINLLGNAQTEAAQNFAAFVTPLLQAGDNNVKIHVVASGRAKQLDGAAVSFEETVASGEFTLRASRRELTSYVQEHGPRLATSTHPENAELVKKFKEAINREWRDEVFMGATTLSPTWSVEMHPYTGVPVGRSVDAEVVLRKKDEADRCRRFELTFTQTYNPAMGDTGGPMQILTGENYIFPCSNATLHEQ